MERETSNIRKRLKRIPFEAICWLGALVLLALADINAFHFSLCPLKNAGPVFCPGCGLGRSITLFFHGDIAASIQLGIRRWALDIGCWVLVDCTQRLLFPIEELEN